MTLTSIEWIALIFAVIGLIKLIVVIFNKQAWYKGVTKKVHGNQKISAIIFVLLAIIIFYYLLRVMNIVQIMAAMAFGTLLIGLGFLYLSKDLLPALDKAIKRKLGFWMWIYILVWIVLFAWTLCNIFGLRV